MWLEKIFIALLLLFLNTGSSSAFLKSSFRNNNPIEDVNGGWNCLGCTVVVSLIEQLAIINNQTVEQSFDKLCSMLPTDLFEEACKIAIAIYGPVIING